MKQQKNEIKIGKAPFPDEKSAEPIYEDTIPASLIKPSSKPTPPGAEPMSAGSLKTPENTSPKTGQLDEFRTHGENSPLTSSLGVNIADNQNSLKAAERGPSLLEDFLFNEKLAHFNLERIPERVVHARGSGAHGYFQVYESLSKYTKAAFLQDPALETRSLSGFQMSRIFADQLTRSGIFGGLQQSFIQKKATLIL